MHGELHGEEVHVGGDARQRFYDARGYGYPQDGNTIALSLVEAAHLLFRGDLDTVDGQDFQDFIAARTSGFSQRFLVYADLRDRGFYLAPARDPWYSPELSNNLPDDSNNSSGTINATDTDFVVFPRGKGPEDGVIEYRIRVVGERTEIPAVSLADDVLAVVDEESELTYLDVSPFKPASETDSTPSVTTEGVLFDDRVLIWDAPTELHERGFYGQPLDGRAADYDALQLSLLEAAYLGAQGTLSFTEGHDVESIVERGKTAAGDHFDRRLRVYRALRYAGMVPKTGFKFGADFRVYADIDSVDDLGHSSLLIRVLPLKYTFSPRDLSLDVRLAHGVRKRMVFALDAPTDDTIRWRSVSRLTP